MASMEKPERETRDLMNVESFSQLPFIRSSSGKDRSSGSGGAFRLFGKEFTATDTENKDHQTNNTDDNSNSNSTTTTAPENITASSSTRKFECHYCCRNFPTSQALGGHQNAHKRERQHAKRAHLQSHDYSLMAYGNHRPLDYQYHHSWANNPYPRQNYGFNFTGNHMVPPITGSPLATWRVPTPHSSFLTRHSQIINTSSNRDLVSRHETKLNVNGIQDHVSLDLHL